MAQTFGKSLTVGFIGLGNMGARMAANLLKAGHALVVHDRMEAPVNDAVARGAAAAQSPADVAASSDVVITMLPSSSHVESVYLGPSGILSNSSSLRPSLLIDASTVDPHTSRAVGEAAATCQLAPTSARLLGYDSAAFVDAPVSGGITGAEAGTLTFMVGGEDAAVEAARPFLSAMGNNVIRCGGQGMGVAAKLCNNLALAIEMAAVAEALALGQRLGVDPATMTRIFNKSSARCWSSDSYNPVPGVMDKVPSSAGYKGGFANHLMAKDLGLAIVAAKKAAGVRLVMAPIVWQLYVDLCESGGQSNDFSSIFRDVYGGQPLDTKDV